MSQFEVNFDGLVGPTHNYAGLSVGNVASLNNANAKSNPKQAALQGLAKMKALHDMGMQQGILAPQERPDIDTLRRLGFTGSDKTVLESAFKNAREVFAACCSASSMWTANAATVSPSADSADNKVHFTPANLTNKFHRSLEAEVTGRILRATFSDTEHFHHHLHLPDNEHFGDEGAANHTRLCSEYNQQGLQIFVFGRYAFNTERPQPKRYPARQTFEACEAISRIHQLNPNKVVYIQQNPEMIDQGVFHNDVIAVGNQNVLFFHEQAFLHKDSALNEIRTKFGSDDIHFIEVKTADVSVQDAIRTYLFNTQIITLKDKSMAIIAPIECKENQAVYSYLEKLKTERNPINEVYYFDVKESMKNGGGPACLRLRVALTEKELAAVNQSTRINADSYERLTSWVSKHYRDELSENDLCDPQLLVESRTALDELTQILQLGSVYPFQQI